MALSRMQSFALALAALSIITRGEAGSVHTVFTTDCNQYFNWQALGMYHSFQKSKQPGPITRLLSCTAEQLKVFKDVDGIPTHNAPSWTIHPVTGDNYSGINKPVAVRDWLNKTEPKEDFILVIDSDTIMREPFDMQSLDLRPGWAVSGFYGYLKGVKNEMAEKYLPDVTPRTDTLAGPEGRRSDQVGGFAFMRRTDLERMIDGWVSITEEVRADPDAWKLSGDIYTHNPGDKPWIAEMYGYSFAAARAGIWHHTDNKVMLYPGYTPLLLEEAPNVLHYGVDFGIKQAEPKIDYMFDKHWYRTFEPLKCNPWTKKDKEGRPLEGLFPNPPHPTELRSTDIDFLKDLLVIETVATLNEALCLRHTQNCPPSTELDTECRKVYELVNAVSKAQKALQAGPQLPCKDENELCSQWARKGECEKNPSYMSVSCRAACRICQEPEGTNKEEKQQFGKEGDQLGDRSPDLLARRVIDDQSGSQDETGEVLAADGKRRTKSRSTQDLLQGCISDSRLSKEQVLQCMAAARKGEEFRIPEKFPFKMQHAHAVENAASEEMRKKPPDRKQQGRQRRLGEFIGEGESDAWTGDYTALLLVGGFVGSLAFIVRCCLPRKGLRSKGSRGGRRD